MKGIFHCRLFLSTRVMSCEDWAHMSSEILTESSFIVLLSGSLLKNDNDVDDDDKR